MAFAWLWSLRVLHLGHFLSWLLAVSRVPERGREFRQRRSSVHLLSIFCFTLIFILLIFILIYFPSPWLIILCSYLLLNTGGFVFCFRSWLWGEVTGVWGGLWFQSGILESEVYGALWPHTHCSNPDVLSVLTLVWCGKRSRWWFGNEGPSAS